MTYERNGKTYRCPVEAALEVIGGKWKPLILWELGEDVLRFSELQRALPGVNAKMLTKQLRELEEDGIVSRTVYPEVPPRVEYAMTGFGKTLVPILQALCDWGSRYLGVEDDPHPGCQLNTPPSECTKGRVNLAHDTR
jgi:DNA-binding HxlR family transcriptional regulator